jgi:hypothetical protein
MSPGNNLSHFIVPLFYCTVSICTYIDYKFMFTLQNGSVTTEILRSEMFTYHKQNYVIN